MSVYTGTGDRGQTSLLGGTRVSKGDLRIEAYGTVDELNSVLGLARAFVKNPSVQEEIKRVQEKLFLVAGELAAGPGGLEKMPQLISQGEISHLENLMDELQSSYDTPKKFVVPGGTPATGTLDQARTVARRAERLVVRLSEEQEIRNEVIGYLNRISDLLWVFARVEDKEELVQTIKGKVLTHLTGSCLTLEKARKLMVAAFQRAQEIAVPMVVAIVDQGGNLVALERHDDALLVSLAIARDKAFTAAAIKLPTHEVAKVAQPGQPLFGIDSTNSGRVVIFGGGFPLQQGDRVVGGIGVSGGSVEEDMDVAQAALKVWENL